MAQLRQDYAQFVDRDIEIVILDNYLLCLAIALATAVVIIAVFNYYIAVTRGESFRRRFVEMAGVSLGVALFSFVIGYVIRLWLGVEV